MSDLFCVNRRIWHAIGALLAVCGLWLWVEGVALDFSNAMVFFYIFAGFAAVSLIYKYVRRDDNIYLFGQLASQWLAATAAIGILSYVSARLALPLTDAALISIDHALFFDWKTYVAWVDALPWLATSLSYIYLSSGPQILATVVLLFLLKRHAHNQRFLIGFMSTAIITVVLAALFPAVGAYVYYNIDVATYYQHIEPAAPRVHEAPLLAMRDHSMTTLLFPLNGLVTFPSFHSALSIVLIYAAWPVLWMRAISLPLNILVLCSTPGDGGHYLTDILGGVAIALLVIYMMERAFKKSATSTAAATP